MLRKRRLESIFWVVNHPVSYAAMRKRLPIPGIAACRISRASSVKVNSILVGYGSLMAGLEKSTSGILYVDEKADDFRLR